jgi:hypothetical protein
MATDLVQRSAALHAADEALMNGNLADASAAYESLLEALDNSPTDEHEDLVYRAGLVVRAALCHYLAGAIPEADEMLGAIDRQLSVTVRYQRDPALAAALAEVQDNTRFYRHRLFEASRGAALELPVAVCPHGHSVPVLPCGFLVEHP